MNDVCPIISRFPAFLRKPQVLVRQSLMQHFGDLAGRAGYAARRIWVMDGHGTAMIADEG